MNRNLCEIYLQLSSGNVNKHILHELKESQQIATNLFESLAICVSLVSLNDIQGITKILAIVQFKHIKIYNQPQKQRLNKTANQITQDQNDHQIVFMQLVQAVQQFQLNTFSLQILNFKINNESIIKTASMLKYFINLKELSLSNVFLLSAQFKIIAQSLNRGKIYFLDISNNILDSSAGKILVGLLANHSQNRKKMADEDLSLQGLCELNIENNKLKSSSIITLCTFLKQDQWVKSLNLKGNEITEEGVEAINEMLNHNESLVSVDLRDNPGFSQFQSKQIFEKLKRNINKLKIKQESSESAQDYQNIIPNNVSEIKKSSGSFGNKPENQSGFISFGDKILDQEMSQNVSISQKMKNSKGRSQLNQVIKLELQLSQNMVNYQEIIENQNDKIKSLEQEVQVLKMENTFLKQVIHQVYQQRSTQQQQQMQPQNYLNQFNQFQQPILIQQQPQQHHVQLGQFQQQPDEENRIEWLIQELTRMMDNADQNHTQPNVTAHLSNTDISPNGNTHIINNSNSLSNNNILIQLNNEL